MPLSAAEKIRASFFSVGWAYAIARARRYLSQPEGMRSGSVGRRKVVENLYAIIGWIEVVQRISYLSGRSEYYSTADRAAGSVVTARRRRDGVQPSQSRVSFQPLKAKLSAGGVRCALVLGAAFVAMRIRSEFRADVARKRLQDVFSTLPPPDPRGATWVPPPPSPPKMVFDGMCGICQGPCVDPTLAVGSGMVYCAQCIGAGQGDGGERRGRFVRLLG